MTPCKVQNFAAAMPTGPLSGLMWQDGAVQLKESFFDCCQGLGYQWQAREPAVRCPLRAKLTQLQQHAAELQKSYPSFSLAKFFTDEAAAALLWSKHGPWIDGEKAPGRLQEHGFEQPSIAWQMSLLASWRYGAQIHVVDFKRLKQGSLLPAEAFVMSPGIRIIIAERVDRLWDAYYQDAFEQLVAFADGYDCLFSVDIMRRRAAPTEKSMQRKSAFAQRIAAKKSQDPLQHLSAHARSRLAVLLRQEMPKKKATQATPGRTTNFEIDIGF